MISFLLRSFIFYYFFSLELMKFQDFEGLLTNKGKIVFFNIFLMDSLKLLLNLILIEEFLNQMVFFGNGFVSLFIF